MAETERVEIYRISDHHREADSDLVISEDEALLRLNGENYRSFYCLPTHLEELAMGHLISEGICSPSGIGSIEVRQEGNRFIIEAKIDQHSHRGLDKIDSEVRIGTRDVWDAVERLDRESRLFKETGGAQGAEIFGRSGSVFAEDISRHCAIDKAIGLALESGMNLTMSSLVTSCRQTGSTIYKAIRSQIPIVITISAPTGLAIESARRFGITLIGFARENRFNIYSHKWRVTGW